MNKRETAEVLAYLCSAYPQVVIRKENAEMYHRFLEDLEFVQVQKALDVLIMESKWFPSVAQIRQAVGELTGDYGPALGVAWAEVLKQVVEVGRYGRPVFSHSAITQAVESIGWGNLCWGNSESVKIQFSQVYKRRVGDLPQLETRKALTVGDSDF